MTEVQLLEKLLREARAREAKADSTREGLTTKKQDADQPMFTTKEERQRWVRQRIRDHFERTGIPCIAI